MSQVKRWATAALRIHSDLLDAQAITSALQTEPTRFAIKGALMSPRNQKSACFESNMWLLESPLAPESELEDHISFLADFIEQKLLAMKTLLKDCQADLFCGYSLEGDQGGFNLEAELLQRLANIPVCLVFNIYASRQ